MNAIAPHAPMGQSAARPPRRWFQFSLRAILLVMFLTGCALTPIVYARRQAAREQQAYALLQELGGGCAGVYSERSPAWKMLLGDDAPGNITCVEFHEKAVTDDQLGQLIALSKLRRLSLRSSHITDRGLVHLNQLPELRILQLEATSITESGLQILEKNPLLETLTLGEARLSPASIRRLQQKLPNLTVADDEREWPALMESK